MSSTGGDRARRYHGLDGLRGFAMLLGIVLHATLPYFSRLYEFEFVWPADDDQSALLALVFDFIHTWRMPVFFLLAGFFAHLVLDRRATSAFVVDRLKRIAVPLVLFGTVVAVIIPPIWVYGWSGAWPAEGFREAFSDRRDLESSGELVGHLWFLYYLLLMYAAVLALRALGGPSRVLRVIQPAWWASARSRLGEAVYARMPLLLALGAVLLLVVRAGNEAKPLWPLNLPDVLFAALFFFYGYGLFARRELVDRLKGDGALAALISLAVVAYFAHLVVLGVVDATTKSDGSAESLDLLWLIDVAFYGFAAVFFSVGLIGLFERALGSPRGWVRWLADSSYWAYIMHLPVVTLLTFYLAHLDRQGVLKDLTGFGWSAELKFLAACLATAALGLVTYRYLVRYTALGTLLNGRRVAGRD